MEINKFRKDKKQKLCLGEYAVSIKGKDILCIPRKWRRLLKGPLYSAYCKDTEYSYLRIFYDRNSMDNYLKGLNNQKTADQQDKVSLVSCSLHRTCLFGSLWRLPETFLNEDRNSEVFLIGFMNSFEVWKKKDWYVMTEKAEKELKGVLSSFT